MQLDSGFRRVLLIFTLLALPLIVGSSCVVLFNSGGGSSNNNDKNDNDNDNDKNDDEIIVISGNFNAPATEGLNYESGALTGITGKDGEFQYVAGSPVEFAIGDIQLGTAVMGKSVITPRDLVLEDTNADTAAVNITRLLQSLDADLSDEVVTIPAIARAKAVLSNESVSAAIGFMDFSDESSFVNSASQLLATLTVSYPFTVTLVDTETVQVKRVKAVNDDGGQ
jgi:hypothetical protein